MISNREIKLIRSLLRKKSREETGLFVVEGEKMVAEAIASEFEIISIFKTQEIGAETMSRITHLSTPSPILALVKQRTDSASVTDIDTSKLYLALDSVRDPGNMGTILRIADWFGIDTVFTSEDSVDIYNPKVVQSSMGSIFRVVSRQTDLFSFLNSIRGSIPIYGTATEGDNIYESQLSTNGIIVMGNESEGVSEKIKNITERNLTIPSFCSGGAESLNVAVATALLCSEFKGATISHRSSVLPPQTL